MERKIPYRLHRESKIDSNEPTYEREIKPWTYIDLWLSRRTVREMDCRM